MKISNQKAQDAAEKICQPLKDKITAYEKEIGKKVMEQYRKQIPKAVLDCFAKFPNFFTTESSVYLGRVGNNGYAYARFEHSLPALGKQFNTDEKKREFVGYINQIETLTDAYNKAVTEIKGAIMALGTVSEYRPSQIWSYSALGRFSKSSRRSMSSSGGNQGLSRQFSSTTVISSS